MFIPLILFNLFELFPSEIRSFITNIRKPISLFIWASMNPAITFGDDFIYVTRVANMDARIKGKDQMLKASYNQIQPKKYCKQN